MGSCSFVTEWGREICTFYSNSTNKFKYEDHENYIIDYKFYLNKFQCCFFFFWFAFSSPIYPCMRISCVYMEKKKRYSLTEKYNNKSKSIRYSWESGLQSRRPRKTISKSCYSFISNKYLPQLHPKSTITIFENELNYSPKGWADQTAIIHLGDFSKTRWSSGLNFDRATPRGVSGNGGNHRPTDKRCFLGHRSLEKRECTRKNKKNIPRSWLEQYWGLAYFHPMNPFQFYINFTYPERS